MGFVGREISWGAFDDAAIVELSLDFLVCLALFIGELPANFNGTEEVFLVSEQLFDSGWRHLFAGWALDGFETRPLGYLVKGCLFEETVGFEGLALLEVGKSRDYPAFVEVEMFYIGELWETFIKSLFEEVVEP